jgi:sugar phosphate isomerase/epimerase
MERYGVRLTQLDAAFPLSRPEGTTIGADYIIHVMQWAKLAGCSKIDTTDDRDKPEGMTDRETLDRMGAIYRRILRVAEAYEITVNIEPHGYYTTKPEFLEEMLSFADSPYLRLNIDVGNVFIAGQDPVTFVQRFMNKIDHVHLKDVSPSLAAVRGEVTGIAGSHCAIGEGVNADNVRRCVELLAEHGYDGVLVVECEGEPMVQRSLEWVRKLLAEVEAGRSAVVGTVGTS